MVKGGARIFGGGRPAGGGTRLQAESSFAFAVAPFPFSKVRVRNGPESSELVRQALFSESFWNPATVCQAAPVDSEASSAPSREPRRRKDFWYICSL